MKRPNILLLMTDQHNPRVAGFAGDPVARTQNLDRLARRPSTPNQYMLPDGRVFDAEASLYDARWLYIPPVNGGGVIPQQFG